MNEVQPKRVYEAATVGDAHPGIYQLYGEKSGHGVAAWTPVDRSALGEPPARRAASRRGVIALLDSGVRLHPWLLAEGGEDFVVEASGWEQARPVAVTKLANLTDDPEVANFGSHLGHATFIAGIIRQTAPDAQVLSMTVMDDMGRVDEENVVAALEWLVAQDDGTVDVVLMAFGRRIENGDDTSDLAEQTKRAIDDLARRGVRVVISAGNGRTDEPVFPASYARGDGHAAGTVVSVGAGTPTVAQDYSSRGDWVTDWRPGCAISTIPLTPLPDGKPTSTSDGEGYARWCGTSFAAAIRAAEYVAEVETVV